MLAKVITLKHSAASKGFGPVLNYIMRAGAENRLPEEQQLEGGEINVSPDELYFNLAENNVAYADDMACVLDWTTENCRRKGRFNGNPVYHVAINWQEGEHPTPGQARRACDHVMKSLGYEEHQAAWSIHRDTDNDHVHLVINRVHPTRFVAISPPFKKDYAILDRCMRELEIEFGHGRANGPYITLDTDNGPQIVRMSRAERRKRGLLKEDARPRLTRGAAAAEYRLGDDSFQSWVSKDPTQDLKTTLQQPGVSWQDVHHCLAQHGVVIQPLGSGFNPHPANRPGDALIGGDNSWCTKGFNPHPANRPGDARHRRGTRIMAIVSIRTRLTGRVMPPVHNPQHYHHNCFNPHPANRPGDAAVASITDSVSDSFNPHPANRPGDATGILTQSIPISGFNPHPANRPGDATNKRIIGFKDAFQSAPG